MCKYKDTQLRALLKLINLRKNCVFKSQIPNLNSQIFTLFPIRLFFIFVILPKSRQVYEICKKNTYLR